MPHADDEPSDTPPYIAADFALGRPKTAESSNGTPWSRASRAKFNDDADAVSPMMLAGTKDYAEDFNLDKSSRQFSARVAKRMSGRLPSYPSSPAWMALSSTDLKSLEASQILTDDQDQRDMSHQRLGELFMQVAGWLQEEKARRSARKAKKKEAATLKVEQSPQIDGKTVSLSASSRRSSDASEHHSSLDKLERIIDKGMQMVSSANRRPTSFVHRPSSIRKLRRRSTIGSSDIENLELDEIVPSCETVLDNSKTMSHYGGASETGASDLARSYTRDTDEWNKFKFEILRLTHTLRLKRWRRVPLEMCRDVEVERLTGALTNAVYVVSPPKDLPSQDDDDDDAKGQSTRKPPPKLLLRVYGAQADHVIDRQVELQILKRLARKNIGPRMLGTFLNGRFEQFFNARTLKPQDLRVPETSKQIAKRMCELHLGIELQPQERAAGPFVWSNWDKWVERCEQVATFVDGQSRAQDGEHPTRLICGVEWAEFRSTVDRYRRWLEEQYGGADKLKEQLVFAHNDTQYGNILRLLPSGSSPLLLPANEHKQLVVIDFEYANANTPGFELANHFSEWCYNYHDPARPFACNTQHYPVPDEQHRFAAAYVAHRATHPVSGGASPGSASPAMTPTTPGGLRSAPSSASLRGFRLDSRAPPAQQREEEAAAAERREDECRGLLREARLWRVACSAQWVAWGLLQARVEGLDEAPAPTADGVGGGEERNHDGGEDQDREDKLQNHDADGAGQQKEEEAEFDYLAYAHDRALFFWSDVLQLVDGSFGDGDGQGVGAVTGLLASGVALPRELVEAARAKRVPF